MISEEQRLGEAGLREALSRLEARLSTNDDPQVSLSEALFWAYALEEFHRDRLTNDVYYSLRSSTDAGKSVAGVIYARGLVTHGLAVVSALLTRPGRTFRSGDGGRRGGRVLVGYGATASWDWKPFDALPRPGKPEKWGRDSAYQQVVQGRPLMAPLHAVLQFLSVEVPAASK